MAWEFSGGSFPSRATPYGQLLKSNCIGCHTATDNSTWKSSIGAPIVYNTGVPGYGDSQPDDKHIGLAAGNFYWTTEASASGQSRGHSLAGIPYVDDTSTPSNQRSSCTANCHGQLSNKGCDSCHLPAHHKGGASTTPIVDSEDGYYRFLGPLTSASAQHQWGVRGYEDPDWQEDSSGHNEYSGEEKTGGYFSINRFCGGCHLVMEDLDEYGGYNYKWSTACLILTTGWPHSLDSLPFPTPSGTDDKWDGYGSTPGPDFYNLFFPIARKDISAGAYPSGTIVYNTNNVLSCLTCHRAHASPYDSMLRWDNTKAWADMAHEEGCKFCHNADPR